MMRAARYVPSVTGGNVVPSGHTRVGGALGECLFMSNGALVVVSSKRRSRGVRRGQGGGHQGGENECCDGLHLVCDDSKSSWKVNVGSMDAA